MVSMRYVYQQNLVHICISDYHAQEFCAISKSKTIYIINGLGMPAIVSQIRPCLWRRTNSILNLTFSHFLVFRFTRRLNQTHENLWKRLPRTLVSVANRCLRPPPNPSAFQLITCAKLWHKHERTRDFLARCPDIPTCV